MKRSIGVTFSAVVLGIATAFTLLLAALLTLLAVFSRNARFPPAPAAQAPGLSAGLLFGVILGFSVLLALFATGAILTLIGFLRLRSRARYSILVIGGFLVFIAICTLFGLAVAATVQSVPNIPPSTMHTILVVQGLFYAGVAAVGLWWMVFFNLRSTKAYFFLGYVSGYAEGIPSNPALVSPPGRFSYVPTSIFVLAGILLFSAVCCAIMALFTMPTFLFGFTFTGTLVHFIYLAYAMMMGLFG